MPEVQIVRVLARAVLQGIYGNIASRLASWGLKKDFWRQAAKELEGRVVKSLEQIALEERARRNILLRREPAGTEIWLDTLVAASTFRDLHQEVRRVLKLPPCGSPISVRVYYISQHPFATRKVDIQNTEWKKGDIIPCHDSLCKYRLRGTILGVFCHLG